MSIKLKFIFWLVKMLPASIIANQARKPSGLFGKKIMSPMFEAANRELNQFMLACWKKAPNQDVLEIGFGPGQTFPDILKKIPKGKLIGVDFSKDMVNLATTRYKSEVDEKTMELYQATIESLPLADNTVDTILTANTLYFWPNPKENIKECHRVLKYGGQLIIGFRTKEQMAVLNLDYSVFTPYTFDDVEKLLTNSGFQNVTIKKKAAEPFESYCAIAIK